jgi:hypothetical protein
LNAISKFSETSPLGKNSVSGYPDPRAEIKKSTEAAINVFLRPNRLEKNPEIIPPMMHPMSALDTVAP